MVGLGHESITLKIVAAFILNNEYSYNE